MVKQLSHTSQNEDQILFSNIMKVCLNAFNISGLQSTIKSVIKYLEATVLWCVAKPPSEGLHWCQDFTFLCR